MDPGYSEVLIPLLQLLLLEGSRRSFARRAASARSSSCGASACSRGRGASPGLLLGLGRTTSASARSGATPSGSSSARSTTAAPAALAASTTAGLVLLGIPPRLALVLHVRDLGPGVPLSVNEVILWGIRPEVQQVCGAIVAHQGIVGKSDSDAWKIGRVAQRGRIMHAFTVGFIAMSNDVVRW